MARENKGPNPQKNAKTVKYNKSDKNENQNSDDRASSDQKNNQSHESVDSVVLIDTDELTGSSGSHDDHRPAIATNVKSTSSVSAYNANTGASSDAISGASGWTRTALLEGTRAGKMPRPWFPKWGWWFLPFALIGGALSAWWGIRHIEGQVQAAAPEILKAAGVDPSGLTFDADYRNIAVAGELPHGATIDEVERLLEESTGARNEDIRHATVTASVAPATEPPPKPEPEQIVVEPTGEISVTAISDGQSVTLSGSVPDQEHASKLLTAAALAVGEDNVVNKLSVLGLKPSAPDPNAQIDRLAQVLPQLGGGIRSAELAIGDEKFSGKIDAIDTSAKSQLESIVATASDNQVTVSASAIEPSLQVDMFTYYQGRQIVLYGEVISDSQRQSLFAAAAESVGENNVSNNLLVLQPNSENAESDERVALLSRTLRQYGGLRSAESRLTASGLYLRGVAKNDAAMRNVVQTLQSGTDESLTVDSEITLLSIENELNLLQEEFDDLASEIRENVVFATNSDVLNVQATEALDKVVDAIGKYERPRITVSGHTDSLGPAADNRDLSTRRASAVLSYLAAKGVDVERLRAIGMGESRPVGDNSTAAGRQQNRRVEFTAVENF